MNILSKSKERLAAIVTVAMMLGALAPAAFVS